MSPKLMELMQRGLNGEMGILSLKEKCDFVRRQIRLMMLEGNMAVIFANALSEDLEFENSRPAQNLFLYCLNRAAQAMPLRADVMKTLEEISPDGQRKIRLDLVRGSALPPDLEQKIFRSGEQASDALYDTMLGMLAQNQDHIGVAEALLHMDLRLFREPTAWLDKFRCPSGLADLWRNALFLHYAYRGRWADALPLWERMPEESRNPYARVYAADNYILSGDIDSGLKNYTQALRQDGALHPVSLRLEALLSPTMPRPGLLAQRKTAVCLYSWNKGPVLWQTLRALARTDTGNSPVFILLNGCTDDSLPRVEALRELFPERTYEIVNLPINIGAPAARNWLIHLPQVQACDHVAFMDDDVVMPKDWLVRYLTEMEKDPQNAVAGCKVVFPSDHAEAPVLQSLYYSVRTARAGLLRLGTGTPGEDARDTGLYTFTRPCLHVMGCLHLLRMSALREIGDFDIGFSPSQLDDVEHDLRTALMGRKIIYCGQVTCEHHQKSGAALARNLIAAQTAIGPVVGHDIKLMFKHLPNLKRLAELAEKV
ncbi:MAG: glycosyltransferase [Desulfovibrio sp.]|jgi:GT2 family glycosyltransferase|nr:glycosyltransferase [Desulfovibrio sp.]